MSPTRKIELKHGKGNSSLSVVPFGATVISWIVDGQENIFFHHSISVAEQLCMLCIQSDAEYGLSLLDNGLLRPTVMNKNFNSN